MAFEAEIKQSIRELQAATVKLTEVVAQANTRLRETSNVTREAARNTATIGTSARQSTRDMADLRKVTRELGGAAGGTVSNFIEMAGMSPKMVGIGAAVAAVTAAVATMARGFMEARAEMEAMATAAEKVRRQAVGELAAAGQELMMKGSPEETRKRYGVERGIVPSNISDEGIARLAAETAGIPYEQALADVKAARAAAPKATGMPGAVPMQKSPNDLFQAVAGTGVDIWQAQAEAEFRRSGFGNVARTQARDQADARAIAERDQIDLQRIALGEDLGIGRMRDLALKYSKSAIEQKALIDKAQETARTNYDAGGWQLRMGGSFTQPFTTNNLELRRLNEVEALHHSNTTLTNP